MKIVHTESSLGWGGQELRILAEAKGLAQRGHELTLICPLEARIYGEAPGWNLRAVALPIATKRLDGVFALRRWLLANRPDVVSTHSSTDSWLAALGTLGTHLPIVRTRHISAPIPRNMLTRWLYGRATRIVTTGEALKREVVERTGVPAQRIDSVPTGADPAVYSPADKYAARMHLGLPQAEMLIGIVATLRSWKGHRYLIDALPAAATLVIVGDGPQREALEAQVQSATLQSRVRFAGNQRDVVPWLQALDIFALPSYANEGVPQALMQAMLVGLPCVTTHVGGIGELARDGHTALVVPPEDVPALRGALQRLIGDEALRAKLGAEARRHCVERFSYQRMLDRMEAIYREAAATS
jgi:glycosyltransferase involved in cell wall biosynthesis